MIKIKETSRDLTKIEAYLLTSNPAMESMKNVEDGTALPVGAWCIFEDTKESTGEIVEILSILSDGKAYATQSKTFMRSLFDIHEIMEGEPYGIVKISGTTKAGRPFVNCRLDY